MHLHEPPAVAAEIDALVTLLDDIDTVPPATYERAVNDRLENLAAVAAEEPGDVDVFRHRCFEACGPVLDESPLHVRTRYKPLGYAGDYQLIDHIYRATPLMDGRGGRWDRYYLDLPAGRGVRDRKQWFVRQYSELLARLERPISVLNLASGPCRDVAEAIHATGAASHGSYFHCVDTEPRAIRFAQEMTAGIENVTFRWENKNALRVRPTRRFDFVWSAGLFDYLNDRVAVALIERMWAALQPGGRAVFGNAHPDNPTRLYMEWCVDWVLIHRDEQDLAALCRRAGVPDDCVTFDREPNGVFAFCIFDKAA